MSKEPWSTGGVVDQDQARDDDEDEEKDTSRVAGQSFLWSLIKGLLPFFAALSKGNRSKVIGGIVALFWTFYTGLLALTGYEPPVRLLAEGFEAAFTDLTNVALVGEIVGTGFYIFWRVLVFLFYDIFPLGQILLGGYGVFLLLGGVVDGIRGIKYWLQELIVGFQGLGRDLQNTVSGSSRIGASRPRIREVYNIEGPPEKGFLGRSVDYAWFVVGNSVYLLGVILVLTYLIRGAVLGSTIIDPEDVALVTQLSPRAILEQLQNSGNAGAVTIMSTIILIAVSAVVAVLVAFAALLGMAFTLFFTAHGIPLPVGSEGSMPGYVYASVDTLLAGPYIYYLVPAALLVIIGYHVAVFENLHGWKSLGAGLYIIPGYLLGLLFTGVFVFFAVLFISQSAPSFDGFRSVVLAMFYPLVFAGVGGGIAHFRDYRAMEHPPLTNHLVGVLYGDEVQSRYSADIGIGSGSSSTSEVEKQESTHTHSSTSLEEFEPVFLENKSGLSLGENEGVADAIHAAELDADVKDIDIHSVEFGIKEVDNAHYYQLSSSIDLNKAAQHLGVDQVTYRPDGFPGMVYHQSSDPSGDALVTWSGEAILFSDRNTDPEAFREDIEDKLSETGTV